MKPDRKKHIDESKSFCMLPWIHLQVDPNGSVKPCCIADRSVATLGNSRESTLKELWNCDLQREIRRDMMADKRHEVCDRCFIKEDAGMWSGRMHANRGFHQHYEKAMEMTQEDGSVEEMKFRLMDIRFSNVCNFKCRSCGPQLSSLWYKDTQKLYGKLSFEMIQRPTKDPEDMWNQMLEHIDHVEEIYFAGGEPLITEEHYRLLKELDRRGHHHVRLIYNTNFSQMKYKDLDVMEIWSKFDAVRVGASLDAPYKRGEYMRKGQVWSQAIENRKRMMEVCPNADFFISCTLGMMNAWIMPDFLEEWYDLGYLDDENCTGFHINPLIHPTYLRMQILPPELKAMVAARFQKTADRFRKIDKGWGFLSDNIEGSIKLMYEEDRTDFIPEMLEKTLKLDEIRNEDFFETFPEWITLKNYKEISK